MLDDAPTGYRAWLIAKTPDPAQAWLDHELTEIILNQGRSALPREVLEHLRLPETAVSEGADTASDCAACAFSALYDGIRCGGCGHDWTCHPGDAGSEPCSHCECSTMVHVF
ncbi:hypothetical protein [Streptomyces sp. NPDC058672]|uniref:hypothetical protein n=1 Tax=Streptomyces sp. NPDC058672 TaxID=3346591 RepID=UPI003648A766